MTEWQGILLYGAGLQSVVLYAVLYSLGGRALKWLRRYLGGVLFALSLIGLSFAWASFTWWHLGLLFGLPAALHLGYGGDETRMKLWRRALYGLVLGSQIFWTQIPLRAIDLGIAQIILSIMASIYLGIRNPLRSEGEEMLIAGLSVIVFPFAVSL